MIRCENGAVSVFLIVILAAMFLFNAVLIDFARIGNAERQTESAVKTSVRSTLSAFDSGLSKYGLFALGPDKEEVGRLFAEALQQNLSAGEKQSFAFLDARVEGEPSVSTLYSLANRSIFERQVLESMKIIAPIEIARRLSGPFRNVSGEIALSNRYFQDAETVERLLSHRENRLDQAWKLAEDTLRQTETMAERYEEDLNAMKKTAREIGNRSKDQVRERLQSLQEELADAPAEMRDGLKEKIAGLRKTLNRMEMYERDVRNIKRQSESDAETLANSLAKFAQRIDEALQLDAKLGDKLKEIREKNGKDSVLNDAFAGVQLLDEDYYGSLKQEFAQAVSAFSPFQLEIQRLQESDFGQKLPADANDVRAIRTFYERHERNEQKRQSANGEKRKKEKEAAEKAQSELNRAKKRIVSVCSRLDGERYERLEGEDGLTRKYLRYNDLPSPEAEATRVSALDGEAKLLAQKGFSLLENGLSRLAILRNSFYVNEYVLHNFNYRTDGKSGNRNTLSDPANHLLKDQEAEYILYGFSSCEENMAAAYEELVLIRMTVRTAETLLHPQQSWARAGFPVLALLTAVAQGAWEAYADTDKLLQGEEVEITRNLPGVKLNYADYLRLFMLLHGSSERMTARMQALIELNTGIDLKEKYTYLVASASASLKLWFLPAAVKLVAPSSDYSEDVQNGRLRIVRRAEMAY